MKIVKFGIFTLIVSILALVIIYLNFDGKEQENALPIAQGQVVRESYVGQLPFYEIIIDDYQFQQDYHLNNLIAHYTSIENSNLNQVGQMFLTEDGIGWINIQDEILLERLGIANNIGNRGGVRALFSLGERIIVYAAWYVDDCAHAGLFDASSLELMFQLECLPVEHLTNLDGVGGGWARVDDNVILLATGTPTTASVDSAINLQAQQDDSYWGKTLMLTETNGAIDVEIFTSGHRNPQGMLNLEGVMIAVEHGPKGGDEINILEPGDNFGWPFTSLGSEYNGALINNSFTSPIISKPPLFSFVPSIGISDISQCPDSYLNSIAPLNCILVSSMRDGSLYFVVLENFDSVLYTERLHIGPRIREILTKGNIIYAATDWDGLFIFNFEDLHE